MKNLVLLALIAFIGITVYLNSMSIDKLVQENKILNDKIIVQDSIIQSQSKQLYYLDLFQKSVTDEMHLKYMKLVSKQYKKQTP